MKKKSTKEEACPYCDPYDSHAHFEVWGEMALFPFARFFNETKFFLKAKFPRSYSFSKKALLLGFIKIMIGVGILKEVDALSSDEQLHNRSLVIARAAHERGITMKALKLSGTRETNLFSFVISGRKIIFEGLPLIEVGHVQPVDFDDKFTLKQILKENGFPYARGMAFHNSAMALAYAKTLGFPLVVKPRSGSLSRHTTCDIRSESALREAIRVVQMISREYVLEEFIPGDVYRVTLVGDRVLACCLREPPNVIGDGIHMVEELITMKNEDARRGDIHQKNFTLHKIHSGQKAKSLLAELGLNSKSVPPSKKKIYLHDKVVLGCGADIHDKTDEIHPDNRIVLERLSRFLRAPIVGIDIIAEDIAKPFREQACAIIEANSLPYIDMHHFPVTGQPRDVAGYIVDVALDKTP